MVSRDGIRWRRATPFFEFMRPGMYDAWDCDHVALHKPLVKDDVVYIYYSGGSVANNANDPGHPQHDWGRREAIGVATMRLDGFVSLDGCGPDSSVTTRPLRFAGDRLEVNVRAPLPRRRTVRGPTGGSPWRCWTSTPRRFRDTRGRTATHSPATTCAMS